MTVTCILAVHNGERFLAEALRSVLDQGSPGLEILAVDDGSTDDTPVILQEHSEHVRILRQEHAGVAAARNLGLREAKGDLIAFQDSDDLWMPGKLDHQLERFRANPNLDLCVGLVQNFWMEELAEEEEGFRGQRFADPVPGFSLPALLARRALFEKVGGFDETLWVGSDNDWFVRARDAGAMEEIVPKVLLRRRLHEGNLTRKDLSSREVLLRNIKASLARRRTR